MFKDFARIRLNMLLGSQAVGAIGGLFWCISDMLVAGNMLGTDALSAVAATVPVTIGAQFFARLVYCGSGYLFAKYQGEFDSDGARKSVGVSIEVAIAVGVMIFAALFFGRDFYFDTMGITGAVRVQAVEYWRWMMLLCATNPFTMTMWRLVYADGETVTTAIGDMLAPPLTIALSIVFTKMIGTAAGSSLGTFVSGLVADLTMMTHLFRKSNSVRPIWNFSFTRAFELLKYSLTDSSTKLCQCAFMVLVNRMVVSVASVAYLPVVSMVALILEIRALLDRVGDAYMPIARMYLGEGNIQRLKGIAKYSMHVAIVVGLVFAVLIFAFAPAIVAGYGVRAGEVFDHGVIALRICSLVLPISSFLSFVCSHYLVIDHVSLSVVETVMQEFVLTAACAVMLALAWGLNALWVGVPLGAFLTTLVIYVYVRCHERCSSLILMPEQSKRVFNLSFLPDEKTIVDVRNRIGEFLSAEGVGERVIARLMLIVEECSMAVVDVAKSKKHRWLRRVREPIVETSLAVGERTVELFVRDTGDCHDLTDSDAKVSNLRSFVIAGMMQSFENRRYLNTIGCNRAAFVFEKETKGENKP